MSLSSKRCIPCRGGIPPLNRAEAESYGAEVPGWMLSHEATRLTRDFKFPDFASALAFVDRVGALAEQEGHHPEIHFGWGHAEVELWTHKINGLHENDFILAAKIDELTA